MDVLTKTKKVELEAIIQKDSPDIIALTEILPKVSEFQQNEQLYKLRGYDIHVTDLKTGRGVVIYEPEFVVMKSLLRL